MDTPVLDSTKLCIDSTTSSKQIHEFPKHKAYRRGHKPLLQHNVAYFSQNLSAKTSSRKCCYQSGTEGEQMCVADSITGTP